MVAACARRLRVVMLIAGVATSLESDYTGSMYHCASMPPGVAALDPSSQRPLSEEDPLDELKRRCFQLRDGFWTYELCPWRVVRQYHTSDRKRGAVIHVLGRHAPHLDETTGVGEHAGEEGAEPALVQRYTDGDDGRSVVVRVTCPNERTAQTLDTATEARDHAEALVAVSEPSPKSYAVAFHSWAICHLWLRPGGAPTPEGERGGGGGESDTSEQREPRSLVGPGAPIPRARLLLPLKGRCFTRLQDFWTYEVCPLKHVRQFRQEAHRISTSFLLGRYSADDDASQLSSTPVYPGQLARVAFSHVYRNGSNGREAVVHVACSRGKNEHSLLRVDETSPLRYSVLLTSPLACDLNCVGAMRP